MFLLLFAIWLFDRLYQVSSTLFFGATPSPLVQLAWTGSGDVCFNADPNGLSTVTGLFAFDWHCSKKKREKKEKYPKYQAKIPKFNPSHRIPVQDPEYHSKTPNPSPRPGIPVQTPNVSPEIRSPVMKSDPQP